jgi:glycosyltransferase involved in cell wall biosynthesis
MLIGIDASRATRALHTGTEAYSLHLIQALIEAGCDHRFRLYMPVLPAPGLVGMEQGVGSREYGVWSREYGAVSSLPRPVRRPGDWDGLRDWAGRSEQPPAPSPQLEVRIIPFPRLWTHLRLAWEVSCHPPDVLFIPAHVMPLVCPLPAAVTVHDLGYLHYPEAHRPLDRWYLDWTTRRHARLAARVIADSQATRADLIRYYGADPGRIAVVYPGRDEALGRVNDPAAIAAVKARYGVSGAYLLYLGTLQPRKNLVRLVEAFARLPSPASGYQLVLAGKRGWLYDDLFARVGSLGLSDRVLFPGYVADEDKAALISGATALVYPSLYEGFGLPVLEAMACGTPVLTSNVSSLPEVAGDAALLIDPLEVDAIAAGMAHLTADADLRRSLVAKGYAQVRKFSWATAARQVLQVLESLVQPSTAG